MLKHKIDIRYYGLHVRLVQCNVLITIPSYNILHKKDNTLHKKDNTLKPLSFLIEKELFISHDFPVVVHEII